jgi:hypothetical protein
VAAVVPPVAAVVPPAEAVDEPAPPLGGAAEVWPLAAEVDAPPLEPSLAQATARGSAKPAMARVVIAFFIRERSLIA